MNKIFKYAIGVTAVLAAVGTTAFFVARSNAKAAEQKEKAAPPEVAVDVTLKVLSPAGMPDAILLPASVEPVKSVKMSAEVAGKIEWIGAEEGAAVKEGQELVRIDKRTLDAALALVQAQYDAAKSNYDRSKTLFDKGMVSAGEYDSVKSQYAVAGATLDTAKLTLAKSSVAAPMSGVLNRKYVEVGEYVTVGQALADVVDVDKVKVVVDVPEKDIVFVSCGCMMGVMLTASEKDIVPGVVTYRSVVADPSTRTFRVEVTADNKDHKLLPGMIVRMALLRRMIENAISVPLFAVIPREGRTVVYVADGNRAVEREVTLGTTDGHNIEIKSGLKAGDKLIVEGQRQLKDGQLLNIVKTEGAA
jgi:membrane fusion protein, multidrug efflux system